MVADYSWGEVGKPTPRFVSLEDVPVKSNTTCRLRVYALVDPRFNDVRYVGVTSRSLDERLAYHLRCPTNNRTRAWFSELAKQFEKPRIVVIQGVRSGWQRAEMEWIAWFRARGELLNVDAGGLLVERGTGWDDIKEQKAIAYQRTAIARSGSFEPPLCTRPQGKKLGQKRKLRPKKFGCRAPSIHPIVRKREK